MNPNPNINILEQLKKQAQIQLFLKCLRPQFQTNPFLFNQNTILKNLINPLNLGFNPFSQPNLTSLLTNNINLNSLLLQSTMNMNNINETGQMMNNQLRNINLGPLKEIPKTIDKVQHMFQPNKLQNMKQIARKDKIKQKPEIIVIDSDNSVKQCQVEKEKKIQTQKIKVKCNNMTKKVNKLLSQNKKIQQKKIMTRNAALVMNNKVPAKKIITKKTKLNAQNSRNRRNSQKNKKFMKQKIYDLKKKRHSKLKNSRKQADKKEKQKKDIKQEQQYSLNSNSTFKDKNENCKIMVGSNFQVQLPQFIFNQQMMKNQIKIRKKSLSERKLHQSVIKNKNNWIQQNERRQVNILLQNKIRLKEQRKVINDELKKRSERIGIWSASKTICLRNEKIKDQII